MLFFLYFFYLCKKKTMNVKEINRLAQEVSAANIAKGFETYTLGTCLALIISEFSEAIEADRKSRRANLVQFQKYVDKTGFDNSVFQDVIKDTFEDEIADAYIRVLDTLGRFKIPFQKCDPGDVTWYVENVNSIPERILYLIKLTADTQGNADVQLMLSSLLVEIKDFCSYFEINLDDHVKYKLMYNETRAHKHGKNY